MYWSKLLSCPFLIDEAWKSYFLLMISGLWCEISPIERGWRGVLRWEARAGLRYYGRFVLVFWGGICWHLVVVFDFRRLCAGVTHPLPLSRGEILDGAFFLVMSGLWCEISPLERGWRGVLRWEARAGLRWFLLLFGEEVLREVGFDVVRWYLLGFRDCFWF